MKIRFAPSPAWIRVAFGTALLALLVSGIPQSTQLFAQSNVSGDIAGTVTDPSDKAVVGATVTVKSQSTDATKVVTTGATGNFRVSLLTPGQYSVTVAAPGFETSAMSVVVSIGQVNTQDVQLAVGSSATTVEVTGTEVPLLHTENANITTSFSMQQVQTLPNPGNDLTFVAQTAPGVVMNTQGGYGNFSAFGLPATSNTFTVNGGYENDPFLNVNNSGATNLLLGNNDVSDVSVISNAYSVEFGGLGGAQINETTRSGGNRFHGNGTYWWNGRAMNANNYFHKQTDPITPRSFDNVNQWAAAVGGPIYRDHSFFFINYEGLRVVLPTSSIVGIPNAAYQAGTIGTDGNCDNATSALFVAGNAVECGFYKGLFGLYNNAKGAQNATPYTNVDPNANQFQGTAGNFTHEYLVSGRIDQSLRSKDHIFGHFKVDKGLQATHTDLISPLFNADSPQPQYEGQLNETHTFSSNIVNQFVFATIYYRAIFTNTNLDAANAIAPFGQIWLNGAFNGLGGIDFEWPQGRNVTGYQFIDDLSWNRGKHTFKFGYSFRRDDVTDYGPSVLTTPLVETTQADFQSGFGTVYVQNFPSKPTQPVALYTEGFYAQDQWKAMPNLTLNAGVRFEHSSNPICRTNCYARLSAPFGSLPTSDTTPLNSLISSGQFKAFNSFQTIAVEPRVGFAFSPFGAQSNTVIRGGFGMFSDSFPAQITDSLLNNPPVNNQFAEFGGLLEPGLPNSNSTAAAASSAALNSQYASGGSASTIGQINFFNAAPKLYYPTYEEWSFQVEQQLPKQTVLSVAYVGNHGYKEPVDNSGINAYNNPAVPIAGDFGPVAFTGLPTSIPNSSFLTVQQIYSGASSNYNGLVASVVNRSKYLTLQVNYAWAHALDEISNGGFNPFSTPGAATQSILFQFNPSSLKDNYGNADYDTRQDVTGSYVFTVPYVGGPRALTDGWILAGTVFHNTGLPFSVTESTVAGTLSAQGYGATPLLAQQIGPAQHHCSSVFKQDGSAVPCFNAGAPGSGASFTDPTAPGQGRRNAFTGPGYTDTDFSVLKNFRIPKTESMRFQAGAQFFNLFNHPNFGLPNQNISGGALGLTQTTVNPPTSILGSFLGGDASPRLIQLKGSITF